jgi:hypothetical protein
MRITEGVDATKLRDENQALGYPCVGTMPLLENSLRTRSLEANTSGGGW